MQSGIHDYCYCWYLANHIWLKQPESLEANRLFPLTWQVSNQEHKWQSIYCNDPNYLDRQVWANSVDPDQAATEGAVWSGSTLFAIPSTSIAHTSILFKDSSFFFSGVSWIFFNFSDFYGTFGGDPANWGTGHSAREPHSLNLSWQNLGSCSAMLVWPRTTPLWKMVN